MKVNFEQIDAQAEKDFGLASGAKFKPREGRNKIRLLSEPVPHQNMYKGEKRFQYIAWVFDYADERVKLYYMPRTIFKFISDLQKTEETSFDEVPMPYDLVLNAEGAGDVSVKYSLIPLPRSIMPQTADEQFSVKQDIHDVLKKLKENEAKTDEPSIEDENPLDRM